jgi:hypothetical protein
MSVSSIQLEACDPALATGGCVARDKHPPDGGFKQNVWLKTL